MPSTMIICGTGHRPDKLGGYSEEAFQKLQHVAALHLADQPATSLVISGGALGWDQALGWAAVELGFPLKLALPFPGFESRWPKKSQDDLENLAAHASAVHYVCEEGYAPWKMQERNKWMVDNSNLVVALWNGTDGGTANCVRYAQKVGKPIVNLWEVFQRV